MTKTYKQLIYSTAGAFSSKLFKKHENTRFLGKYEKHNSSRLIPTNSDEFGLIPANSENIEFLQNKINMSYKRGHLYSAAGAFSPMNCSTKHEHIRNSEQIWTSCLDDLYSLPQAPFSRCSTNHEKNEICQNMDIVPKK